MPRAWGEDGVCGQDMSLCHKDAARVVTMCLLCLEGCVVKMGYYFLPHVS